MDALFTHATILIGDDSGTIISDGAIAIQGDTIQAVGPSADLEAMYTDRPQYNCSGKAIMPGFINSHTHTVLAVLRGTVEDMDVGSVYG